MGQEGTGVMHRLLVSYVIAKCPITMQNYLLQELYKNTNNVHWSLQGIKNDVLIKTKLIN